MVSNCTTEISSTNINHNFLDRCSHIPIRKIHVYGDLLSVVPNEIVARFVD